MSNLPSSHRESKKHLKTESSGVLPESYGDTKIVVLPRDPFWIYAYWEVSEKTTSSLSKKLSKDIYEKSRWILRVYDVTDINFNGKNAHRSFDIPISLTTGSWYINCGQPNRVWCVDLGLLSPEGRFILVARSNIVPTPRYGVSPITDEKWGILKDEFEKLLHLSGVTSVGKGSFDVARLMKEKWEELLSMPSSGVVSSLAPQKLPVSKKKDFWLKAETELIVYGSTEKDARLKIQEKSYPIRPDGSFSIRMALPDGTLNIPIEATSKDGSMKRKITFEITRTKK